jgi:hypothetical protein
VPLEFAKGDTSFNPQPTARNLNKPAPMLRVGQNGEGDTQDFAIVLAAVLGFWTVLTLFIADVFDQGARSGCFRRCSCRHHHFHHLGCLGKIILGNKKRGDCPRLFKSIVLAPHRPRSLTHVNWLGGVRGRTARKAVWF